MTEFNLASLQQPLHGIHSGENASFETVSIDTRTLTPGDLFVAIKGPNFDGHAFIDAAIQQGACAVLVSEAVNTTAPSLRVADTVVALGQLARLRREQLQVPVVAITGSCGKTTTRAMLASILTHCGSVHAGKKSFNNHYGLPLTLLGATAEHDYVVVEMGANHQHEIAYLTQIARPTVAGITLAAPVHLEGFGSVLNVAQAKGEIFQGLTPDGVACINIDDIHAPLWRTLAKEHKIVTFGYTPTADIHALQISVDADNHASFLLQTPLGQTSIVLPLLGEHNIVNALAAASLAFAAGASLTAIQQGLTTVTPVDNRMVRRMTPQGIEIFDDSYNANPIAVAAALRVLGHKPGKKIVVLGEMSELGELSSQYHQQLGEQVLACGIDCLLTLGEMTQHTVHAFGQGAYYFSNHAELIAHLQQLLATESNEYTQILVKGSRSMQMEKVVAALLKGN